MSSPDDDNQRKHVAFEILVREHHRRLLAYAQALAKDQAVSEDLVQDAFITAYRKLDQYDARRDFASWMRGIIRFKYLEWKRARNERTLSAQVLEQVDAIHQAWDHVDASAGDDALAALRLCLDRLSGVIRLTIEAFYFSAQSCAQIAAATGSNEVAVKKRLQRAREALFDCISGRLTSSPGVGEP